MLLQVSKESGPLSQCVLDKITLSRKSCLNEFFMVRKFD